MTELQKATSEYQSRLEALRFAREHEDWTLVDQLEDEVRHLKALVKRLWIAESGYQ